MQASSPYDLGPRDMDAIDAAEDAAEEKAEQVKRLALALKGHASAALLAIQALERLGAHGDRVDDFRNQSALDLAAIDPAEIAQEAHREVMQREGWL